MTYAIKRRRGSDLFAGFTPGGKVKWTSIPAKAMTGDHMWARGQAACLRMNGDDNVQLKPVRIS